MYKAQVSYEIGADQSKISYKRGEAEEKVQRDSTT